MEITIVVLAKSKIPQGYNIIGINLATNQLVRLVSEEDTPLNFEDIFYPNDIPTEKFDVVQIEVTENQDLWYQPENLVVDTEYYFLYVRQATWNDIMYALHTPDFILNNVACKLSKNDIQNWNGNKSIELILASEVNLKMDNIKLSCNIKYNEHWYNNLSLTDDKLIKYYVDVLLERKNITLENVLVVVGLEGGEDGSFYKVVDNIIHIPTTKISY